jgi:integrase
VKRKNHHNERDRIISEEEYAKILQYSPQYLKPIIIVAWNTAMRLRETLNLKWSNVDLKERVIVLEAEQTKGKERRLIPMNEEVFKSIKEQIQILCIHLENVFLYHGKPLQSVDRAFKRAITAAGIENFRFHDIWHCVITRWRRERKDYLSIRKIIGHKTIKEFVRYNSFDLDDLRKVVDESKVHTNLHTSEYQIQKSFAQVIGNQQSTDAGVVQR